MEALYVRFDRHAGEAAHYAGDFIRARDARHGALYETYVCEARPRENSIRVGANSTDGVHEVRWVEVGRVSEDRKTAELHTGQGAVGFAWRRALADEPLPADGATVARVVFAVVTADGIRPIASTWLRESDAEDSARDAHARSIRSGKKHRRRARLRARFTDETCE